ncbi:MAG: hypothetical protein F4X25_10730 [Chloroflexi bacterium]|nr:hypothetical protein [Chloroflexota bacterium]
MPRDKRQRAAYEFFLAQLDANEAFTVQDLVAATGWAESSVTTYLNKQYHELVERRPGETLRVRPRFRRISWERFRRLSTQRRQIFQEYRRRSYDAVVQYEFLLPLTREDQLRESLDSLFFVDAIRQRLDEIDIDELRSWVGQKPEERVGDYLQRLTEVVGRTFGGYSVSHVNGRFRDRDLLTREDAARLVAGRDAYIIDETTASVRFIVPIASTERQHEGTFADSGVDVPHGQAANDAAEEVGLIRRLFFGLFVEAVVSSIQGEAEIWLIERGPQGERLFVWERLAP